LINNDKTKMAYSFFFSCRIRRRLDSLSSLVTNLGETVVLIMNKVVSNSKASTMSTNPTI
jgi:hypothetical protein